MTTKVFPMRADRLVSTQLMASIAWGEPAAVERAMRADRYNRRKAPFVKPNKHS